MEAAYSVSHEIEMRDAVCGYQHMMIFVLKSAALVLPNHGQQFCHMPRLEKRVINSTPEESRHCKILQDKILRIETCKPQM